MTWLIIGSAVNLCTQQQSHFLKLFFYLKHVGNCSCFKCAIQTNLTYFGLQASLFSRSLNCFFFSGPNVTFVFVNALLSWSDAQSYCREYHSDLASVRNQAENQKMTALVPANQIVWFGLYRDAWIWSDGSNSTFRNWNQNEPSGSTENCAAAYFVNDGWEDWSCDIQRAFICYSGKTHFTLNTWYSVCT